ncbi:MAG TPA: LysM peptidoglycan-binding domain-containing protein [Thermomicrobiales bacterium]|nr:LysM peptidoglycan-binding domain-containing protein [Thermomicrobiales bacterium]
MALAVALHGADATAAAGAYTVQPGDTLSEIAEAYGVPLATLVAANGIADPNLIVVGTDLAIPGAGAGPASPAPAPEALYRVQAGDTLAGIAAASGTSLAALLAANPQIPDPNLIVVGQVVRLPRADLAAMAALLASQARAYGLDPALLQALAWQESGWQQDVVSPSGAVGVMQILPDTGAWIAADLVGAPLDIAGSAADNVEAGAALLRFVLDRAGSEELALAYYYQGPGSVAQHGITPDTQQYIANVLAARHYIAAYGVPPPGN